MEIYKKYRPVNFSQVVGQNDVVQALVAMGKRGAIPHTILLSGPSGCGKTTLGRILRRKLGCSDTDFVELNGSSSRGIDDIRQIERQIGGAPLGGKARVWMIDECHALTGDAQNAFLKLLEDTPAHVYFILCTTDPGKLKKTIITRSTHLQCKAISAKDLRGLLDDICQQEGLSLADATADKIIEMADGSARHALVLLHKVSGLEAEDQIKALGEMDLKAQAIEIARKLMSPKTSWKSMAETIAAVEDDPEGIRRLVMAYAESVLLKGDNARAAMILEEFRDPFYDTKRPGLTLACYNIIRG